MPARLDFKAIAESVDIFQVAQALQLVVKNGRADCPICESERSIELVEETNTFLCYAGTPRAGNKYLAGDCIALYAHIKATGMYQAAKEISEQLVRYRGIVHTNPDRATVSATTPQKPGEMSPSVSTAPSPPRKGTAGEFDPEAYAAKLAYSPEVAALGISEADAAQFQIGFASTGFHRGKVVFPIRHPSGEIAGFASYANGEFKFPTRWLPVKVVQLKRA